MENRATASETFPFFIATVGVNQHPSESHRKPGGHFLLIEIHGARALMG
jgi:hypothetical protein